MDVLRELFAFLKERNIQAHLVGGWVRDRLLGRADVRDVDVVVPIQAIELARAFSNLHGGAFYLMDAEHKVARALFGKAYVDFAELRGDIASDLATRDFTINAMALPATAAGLADDSPEHLAKYLVDPFHGLDDLKKRQVRAVSEGVFRQDPVRLLRALRVANLIEFEIEDDTGDLIRRDAGLLASASMERARDEFFKILDTDNAASLIRKMDEWGLVRSLLPEADALKGVAQPAPHVYDVFEHSVQTLNELVKIQANGYRDIADGSFGPELESHFAGKLSGERTRGTLLRLIGFLHDIGKSVTSSVDEKSRIHFYGHEARGAEMVETIARRLKLSNVETTIATRTIESHLRPPQLARSPHVTNRAVYRFFRDTRDAGIDVCVLALADTRAKDVTAQAQDSELRAMLNRLLAGYFRHPEISVSPPQIVDGKTLMQELNLSPGPRIGKLLEAVREAQVDGQVTNREDALAFARKMLNADERRKTNDG